MTQPCMTRPTWAEVSRIALRANYRVLRSQAARVDADVIAVIKANAYGHGADEALATLSAEACGWFAVTCVDEARPLQSQSPACRVLLLSGVYEGEADEIARRGFTPVLALNQQLAWLATATVDRAEPFPVHLEIDTGMARQGIPWDDREALRSFAITLQQHPALSLEAVMTHFASPEDEASPQTAQQIDRFRTALATLRAAGCTPPVLHAGNSASLFVGAQAHALRVLAADHGAKLLLRPGIALYGYGPHATERGLSPVLSWKTRITALRTIPAGEPVSYNAIFRAPRPTRIALLPVGYADGYNRLLSNSGEVLVRGQRARVAGRVTMDQIMIDVTEIADVAIGDEAVLLGQQGSQRIDADEMAAHARTIAYEVLCAIGARVPRRYL
jgi:alanine racemase